jgi:EpsI family protein
MNVNHQKVTNLLLGIAMIAAAGLAVAITPTQLIADQKPLVNLDSIIPKQFGDWREDEKVVYQQVSPEVKAALDKIYTQVLTRTYVNSRGYRVMLTIPYGKNQSDGLSAHDPEGCYPSQGFKIMTKRKEVIRTSVGEVPVRRMEAVNGPRYEPVTYWFMVGSQAVNNDLDKKVAQFRYALRGEIPDGLMFRVSSIDPYAQQADKIQVAFIDDLLKTLPADARTTIAGIRP